MSEREIQHRICQGHTYKEIMKQLGIKERTFYYYKEKMYQQSAEIQAKKTGEVLAFEMQILNDRLSRIYRHLEERLTATEKTRARDLAEIATAACEIAKTNIKLECEGLRALDGINNKLLANKKVAQQQQNISQN
jgi:FixJ family two-component response regulator